MMRRGLHEAGPEGISKAQEFVKPFTDHNTNVTRSLNVVYMKCSHTAR